jgi:hypothetical protein
MTARTLSRATTIQIAIAMTSAPMTIANARRLVKGVARRFAPRAQ